MNISPPGLDYWKHYFHVTHRWQESFEWSRDNDWNTSTWDIYLCSFHLVLTLKHKFTDTLVQIVKEGDG